MRISAGHQGCIRRGGKGFGTQMFVYQNWPHNIFPIVNFVFPAMVTLVWTPPPPVCDIPSGRRPAVGILRWCWLAGVPPTHTHTHAAAAALNRPPQHHPLTLSLKKPQRPHAHVPRSLPKDIARRTAPGSGAPLPFQYCGALHTRQSRPALPDRGGSFQTGPTNRGTFWAEPGDLQGVCLQGSGMCRLVLPCMLPMLPVPCPGRGLPIPCPGLGEEIVCICLFTDGGQTYFGRGKGKSRPAAHNCWFRPRGIRSGRSYGVEHKFLLRYIPPDRCAHRHRAGDRAVHGVKKGHIHRQHIRPTFVVGNDMNRQPRSLPKNLAINRQRLAVKSRSRGRPFEGGPPSNLIR